MAVNARPISLNMSFISALALNLDINAAIRRQACDQIVAVLLIALHRRPAFTVTLRPYCRRRYALRNQRITHRRSEEHTSELQSLMRISYAVFFLKKKTTVTIMNTEYFQKIENTDITQSKNY